MKRFRVWLAQMLTKGTDCCVARSNDVSSLQSRVNDLARYVDESGGLQDPRRIRAYRRVLRIVGDIRHDLDDIAA